MRENGAGGTIEAPRQARAVIHVKNLGHRTHLYTPPAYRKCEGMGGGHIRDDGVHRPKVEMVTGRMDRPARGHGMVRVLRYPNVNFVDLRQQPLINNRIR